MEGYKTPAQPSVTGLAGRLKGIDAVSDPKVFQVRGNRVIPVRSGPFVEPIGR